MERNIAYTNNVEAELKAEIDEREKRLAEEKKQAIKDMQECFEKIGLTSERYGSDLQSTGSLLGVDEEELEPQELTPGQLKAIKELYSASGNTYTDALLEALKNYGYTQKTFMRKYYKFMWA